MTILIALCVPHAQREQAKAAGAFFDGAEKCWKANIDRLAAVLPFVPYRFRPDRKPPYLRPWMVPQSLWGRNLRALLAKEDWDHIRKDAYARSGSRCRMCGGRGPKWPVEADEGWHYDDTTRVQTLKGVIALCPDCHAVRHWGKTVSAGKQNEALAWMMEVNGWTHAEASRCADDAMRQWHERSGYNDWRCDISWAARQYGVTPIQAGEAIAQERNQSFVQKARAQFGSQGGKASYLQHLLYER